MSERTDDPGFQEYSWTDDVNHTLGPLEATPAPQQKAPGESSQDNGETVTPVTPDAPIIRAAREDEGWWNSRMPYNKYMEYRAVQALSGAAKGVVRGIGLEVHPSLDADTPVEEAFSNLTKTWHPGLDVPKAAVMAVKGFSGTPLNPEEQRGALEGGVGYIARFAPYPIRKPWDALNMGNKVIGTGKTLLDQ